MVQRTLFGRFKLNALSHSYGQLITLAVQLLLVPFFLAHWGTVRYSDWLVISGVPMMLTLLDLGVAQSLASQATTQAAALKHQDARTSLQTGLAFTLILCIAILLIAFIIGSFVNWPALLRLNTLNRGEATQIVWLMAGYLCAGLLGGPLDAWFRAIDRAASGAFLLANRRMVDLLISIGVLSFNGTATTLAAFLLVGQLVTTTLLYLQAVRWSPWPVFGLADASLDVFKKTLKPALAYMGFPIAQVATLQGGLQLLNQTGAPETVVAFVMGRTLMRLVIQIGVVTNNALKPEISRLAGTGNLTQAEKFAMRAAGIVLFGSIAAYLILIFFGPTIFQLWSHEKIAASRIDLSLIGLHAVFNVAWFIPAATLIATNRHSTLSLVYGLSSTVALIVWALLFQQVPPIIGASAALLLPELAALLYIQRIRRRETSKNWTNA